jgi:hypothetical protein
MLGTTWEEQLRGMARVREREKTSKIRGDYVRYNVGTEA